MDLGVDIPPPVAPARAGYYMGEAPPLPVASVQDAEPPVAPFEKVDEFLEPVTKRLKERMGDAKFAAFSALLKSCEGIIAGGSILRAIVNYQGDTYNNGTSKDDFDIYIPVRNYPRFLDNLAGIGSIEEEGIFKMVPPTQHKGNFRIINASFYCRSFLRKNGIRRITSFALVNALTGNIPVDIMAVRGRRTPQQVATNFDLTFCQIWYDGESVYASHPNHIREKHGVLQGDYVQSLINGNHFLKSRLEKYRRRGFTISMEAKAFVIDPKNDLAQKCTHNFLSSLENAERRKADPVFQALWKNTAFLRFITNCFRTYADAKSIYLSSDVSKQLLDIPVEGGEGYNANARPNIETETSLPSGNAIYTYNTTYNINLANRNTSLISNNGYDTDDLENEENKYALAIKWAQKIYGAELTGELAYGRAVNKLLEMHNFPSVFVDGIEKEIVCNLGTYIDKTARKILDNNNSPVLRDIMAHNTSSEIHKVFETNNQILKGAKMAKYYMNLLKELLRKVPAGAEGYYFADEGDTVYDIHEHPLEAGINQENIMNYLKSQEDNPDKLKVTCYYKPGGDANCNKTLTLQEVYYMAGPDYFNKSWYRAKNLLPTTGLDNYMDIYGAVLGNVRSLDRRFGNVFHESVCPFCLEPISRYEGCMYMTHQSFGDRNKGNSPYCKPKLVVKDLIEKYKNAARSNLREDYGDQYDESILTLEMCIECGRPCYNHTHFSSTAPYRGIPNLLGQDENGIELANSKCPAGGRAELFARILAIRDVYRNSGDGHERTSAEERRLAALAADNAPNDDDLMAKGRAIADKLPAEREFANAPLPTEKKYRNYEGLAPLERNSVAPEVPAVAPAQVQVQPQVQAPNPVALADIHPVVIAERDIRNVSEDYFGGIALDGLVEQAVLAVRLSPPLQRWNANPNLAHVQDWKDAYNAGIRAAREIVNILDEDIIDNDVKDLWLDSILGKQDLTNEEITRALEILAQQPAPAPPAIEPLNLENNIAHAIANPNVMNAPAQGGFVAPFAAPRRQTRKKRVKRVNRTRKH